MFAEITKSILEFLKLAPRYLLTIALITGLLLFLPHQHLESAGVKTFVDLNREWIGLTFFASVCIWGVAVLWDIWNWLQRIWLTRKIHRLITKKLESMTEDEKQILRYYFAKNTHANKLKIDDGVVQELVAHHIIYRSAQMSSYGTRFAHNITDFAWNYIHANPYVLDGSTKTYRSDKIDVFE